jgi:hypothetical protein
MMSHRLLMTSVNMSTIVNSPLKIGLNVEHEGAYYKISNFYRQQNSVNQYIIKSLKTNILTNRTTALVMYSVLISPDLVVLVHYWLVT